MTVAWDKTDENVWYGKLPGGSASNRICLVVERLPDSSRWDWAIWQSNDPRILRRGVASGGGEATMAAETAASSLIEKSQTSPIGSRAASARGRSE